MTASARISAIAINTFRESVRSKILYAVFFFAAVLLLGGALFGTFTIGDRNKVIMDFGLFGISFFTVAYAVISGAALLHKELSRKTVHNILSKAVHRWEFLCGKYFGMLFTIAVMIGVMGPALIGFVMLFSGKAEVLLLLGMYQIFLQLVIICAFTIFFSSIVVTPVLSGAFTFGVFLAGRSSEYLLYFVENGSVKGVLAAVLKASYYTLPHLQRLDIADQIVYGRAISAEQVVVSTGYAVGYAGVLLVLAAFFFRNKEFR